MGTLSFKNMPTRQNAYVPASGRGASCSKAPLVVRVAGIGILQYFGWVPDET